MQFLSQPPKLLHSGGKKSAFVGRFELTEEFLRVEDRWTKASGWREFIIDGQKDERNFNCGRAIVLYMPLFVAVFHRK